MGIFDSILYGFQVTLQPANLLSCFVGVVIGTLVGVLPGIGPVGAMSILLPATFGMSHISSMIMLAGVYYGAMYGGSTTSILVNIPGETASIVTCLDGYQMARQGRAGPALGISAMGSFIAGTLSVVGLMLVANPLADAALRFGPPEYFALMCAGLIVLTYLVRGSMVKALMMALVGLLLGNVGLDIVTGLPRYTFGLTELKGGVEMIPMAMGLFGISEVLINIEQSLSKRQIFQTHIGHLWPSVKDWSESIGAILRGSVIGFFVGIFPGEGAFSLPLSPMRSRRRCPNIRRGSGKGPSQGLPGLNQRTMLEPEGP
jgi:putative tricarboxylic transport membrane protein